MKNKFLTHGAITVLFFGLSSQAFSQSTVCNGKFADLITDYCWSAHFPIKIGKIAPIKTQQEDNDSTKNTSLVCTCGSGIDMTVGSVVSFWESSHLVDVARKPFCLVGLGGIDLGDIMDSPQHGQSVIDGGATSREAFYHFNLYANPVLYFIGSVSDNTCLEQTPFDLYYSSSWDVTWNDEELSATLYPLTYLFANVITPLASSADCLATSAGFPQSELFFSAACQGGMYPLTGTVSTHKGTVPSTSLVLQKALTKMYQSGAMWGTSGNEGLCHKYPKYIMDKADIKYSMVFPTPQRKTDGRCAQPLGRSTAIWGSATTFPFYGEDVAYQVFRKRDCCVGASLVNAAK